jgi:hypothetical protein
VSLYLFESVDIYEDLLLVVVYFGGTLFDIAMVKGEYRGRTT